MAFDVLAHLHLLPFKENLLTEGFPDLVITEKFNSPALKTIEGEATRFAEIDKPIYNAVVGNPPYVRPERSTAQTQHLRHQPPSNPSKVSIGIYDK
jgi:hypothetical protein